MNLKQFKYVLVLSEMGSFAKAADSLGISQPSLSQYIKKIEQQLDVDLFIRAGGGVRLTDAGRVYIDVGRKILDLEHQMIGSFNDLAEHKTGSVVIGTSPYRSAAMMPLVASKFKQRYPGIHLVVEEMTSCELIEATEHGQFDLCLTMLPVDERLFEYEKIDEEELILAVPSAYPEFESTTLSGKKYPAIDVTLLDGKGFVMLTDGQFMQQALNNLVLDRKISFCKAAVVKSLEAQIAMVRAGVGMALLPSGIERFCSPDDVRFYSLRDELPKREVVVIWRKDTSLNQVVRELISIIKEINW